MKPIIDENTIKCDKCNDKYYDKKEKASMDFFLDAKLSKCKNLKKIKKEA